MIVIVSEIKPTGARQHYVGTLIITGRANNSLAKRWKKYVWVLVQNHVFFLVLIMFIAYSKKNICIVNR